MAVQFTLSPSYVVLSTTTIALNGLVISSVLLRSLRRYPIVFVFCCLQILFVVASNLSLLVVGIRSHLYAEVWWTGDFLAHFGITLLIVSLIRDGLQDFHYRNALAATALGAVMVIGAISAIVLYQHHLTPWFTPVTRNLSFAEEILNFALWGVLLQKRTLDVQLLMVSAGIGLQVTGEVIGYTLRLYISPELLWLPDMLRTTCELICLLLWIWAFRQRRSDGAPPMGSQMVGSALIR